MKYIRYALARKDKHREFVDENIISILLKFIAVEFNKSDKSSVLSIATHKLLLQLAHYDKKIGLKAKLIGDIASTYSIFRSVIIGYTNKNGYITRFKLYNDVIRLYLSHRSNRKALGKAGLIEILVRFLVRILGLNKTRNYSLFLPYKLPANDFKNIISNLKNSIPLEFYQQNLTRLQLKFISCTLLTLVIAFTNRTNCERALKVGCMEVLIRLLLLFYFSENSNEKPYFSVLLIVIRCLVEFNSHSSKARSHFFKSNGLLICYLILTNKSHLFIISDESRVDSCPPPRKINPEKLTKKRAFSLPDHLANLPQKSTLKTMEDTDKSLSHRYFTLLVYRCLPKTRLPLQNTLSSLKFPNKFVQSVKQLTSNSVVFSLFENDDDSNLSDNENAENCDEASDSDFPSSDKSVSNFNQGDDGHTKGSNRKTFFSRNRREGIDELKSNYNTRASNSINSEPEDVASLEDRSQTELSHLLKNHQQFFPEWSDMNEVIQSSESIKSDSFLSIDSSLYPIKFQSSKCDRYLEAQKFVRTLLDFDAVRLIPLPDFNLATGSHVKVGYIYCLKSLKEPFTNIQQALSSQNESKPASPFIKEGPPIDLPSSENAEAILNDTSRVIHPLSLINQTVFDLDELHSRSSVLNTQSSSEVEERARSPSFFNTPNKLIILGSEFPCETSKSLKFESRFECGNLRKAIQIRSHEYDLILSPDINLNSRVQWFYFAVSGMESGVSYRFNIINLEKVFSEFSRGMQPLMYSATESNKNPSATWIRVGTRIKYYRNNFYVKSTRRPFYTATFIVEFPYNNDVCFLAYHYPYTYSRLLLDIDEWQKTTMSQTSEINNSNKQQIYFRVQNLTTTLLKNIVPLITITENCNPQKKDYIILTARVHPGESNSSWALRGLMNHLLDSKDLKMIELRKKFIFKIVPMLNPDGVIVGKCSLSAQDLNRQWMNPHPTLHPEIFHTKRLFQILSAIGKSPFIYMDFHGHSYQKNIFLYGCLPSKSWAAPFDLNNPCVDASNIDEKTATISPDLTNVIWSANNPSAFSADFSALFEKSDNKQQTQDENVSCTQLASIMHQLAPAFSKFDCNYSVQKKKETTGRIVVWREFKVLRSFTIESSYCGVSRNCFADKTEEGHQISTIHLESTGATLCDAFLQLDDSNMFSDMNFTERSQTKRKSRNSKTIEDLELSLKELLSSENEDSDLDSPYDSKFNEDCISSSSTDD